MNSSLDRGISRHRFKASYVLLLSLLSLFSMPKVHATGGIQLLRGSHEDTVEVMKAKTASSSSALMNKISTVIASCKGCDETASPSPYPVTPGVTPFESKNPTGGDNARIANRIGNRIGDRVIKTGAYFIGCYEKIDGIKHVLENGSESDQEKKCGEICGASKYFSIFVANGINSCNCYVDPPMSQISLNRCAFVSDTKPKMDVLTYISVVDTCSQEGVRGYRDKLVQESRDLGFDHIENKWKHSAFQHFNNICSTNMYKLSTETGGNTKKMTIHTNSMNAYAAEIRSSLQMAIDSIAHAGYDSPLFKASGKVSGSLDYETNSFFKTEGAKSAEASIFYSFGVHRLVKVDQNFRDQSYFVMFNQKFLNALRTYKGSNYAFFEARHIFQTYGTTVLERGYVGGFIRRSSTMTSLDVSLKFSSAQEAEMCFGAAIEAEGGLGKFEAGGSGSFESCSANELEVMQSSRKAFEKSAEEVSYVGGNLQKVDGVEDFVVTPETAQLITFPEMYPEGKKLGLRFLTEYLKADKISPTEYTYSGITY